MSLARKHFQRVMAAKAAAAADPGEPIKANAYELELIRLADAKRALKQVQSIERKAEVKRLNVNQTHDEAIKVSGRTDTAKVKPDPTIPKWRKDLRHVVGNATRAIQNIHKEMIDSGCSPDEDDLELIGELTVAVEKFLATKVMEA